jgi:mono/diheme cytochrome c family protein
MRIQLAALAILALVPVLAAQRIDQGKTSFESRCARCHAGDGNGGEMGPAITRRLPPLDQAQLEKLIRDGIPTKGMPPNVIEAPELADLIGFLRTIERREGRFRLQWGTLRSREAIAPR